MKRGPTLAILAVITSALCWGDCFAARKDEPAGSELEKLGARTGMEAAALWPRLTPEMKALQRKNRFTLVIIGRDWTGGVEGLRRLHPQLGVRGVMFTHPKVTDEWCECLRALPKLKEVYFQQAGITDQSIAVLQGLQELEAISLCLTSVTDRGLASLKNLPRLQWLSFAGTKITDEGLAHLKGLTELRHLNLDYTDTTGAGNLYLRELTKMEWLRLSGRAVIKPNDVVRFPKAGVRHLAKMKKLRYLSIGGMDYSEADMKKLLNQLPELPSIDTSDLTLTRDGWKERDVRAGFKRAAQRIRDNVGERSNK